ncbi:MAG TPA: insulinase family protein [Clostridiaceae bacterium]
MELVKGGNYCGFSLIQEDKLLEINSDGYLFSHIKTGARLYYISNKDDNKVFSISFKTPPKDNTGVAHILEHSVLCGSRKFKSKEPFVELAKGSLNTFLNAMTFPDKTMYPVASKNSKDLYNLMDVYLDAVFHPNIYDIPEIMLQEGWHYEFNDKEELSFSGVVFNEMKGAYSSPEGILLRKVKGALFPDNSYGVESGGDPDYITDLTMENFLSFHKEYYHPSNSYIYLYGDIDIKEALSFIDGYLSNFELQNVNSEIKPQRPFSYIKEFIFDYPISNNEVEEEKTYLSLNYALEEDLDGEKCLAMEILEHMLLETSAAPLKKTLLDAKIGKDVFGSFNDGLLQPIFNIVVKNSDLNKVEDFKKVTLETLKKLVKNGIDKKTIEASINIKEFELREEDFRSYPKGLMYNIKIMSSWLYGGQPKSFLSFEKPLKNIKKALTTNYFENFIKSQLLDNKHAVMVAIKPIKGLSEIKTQEEKSKLELFKSILSIDQIDDIKKQTAKLKERQSTEDTASDLETLPLLELKDINRDIEKLPIQVEMEGKIKILKHELFTNGIFYFNLYFDSSVLKEEELSYISLLLSLLGKVKTEKYTYEELSNEINTYTGGIDFYSRGFTTNGSEEFFLPKVLVKGKVVEAKLEKLIEIMNQIMNLSKFDDKNRIKEIVQEIRSGLEMTISQSGHMVALNRLNSYFSPLGKFEETTKGISYYNTILDLDMNFDRDFEKVKNILIAIAKKLFNKNNLIISITGEGYDYKDLMDKSSLLFNNLNEEVLKSYSSIFKEEALNEAFMTSSKVQYVAKGYNYKKLGYKYSGSLRVLKTICSYDYLWNNIRVLGGAYGCVASFQRNGNVLFASYRDPNIEETINTYMGLYKFIKELNLDSRQIRKYIIGTISEMDTPLTASMKGEEATARYISKVSHEELLKEREEILNTSLEDIRGLKDMIGACMDKNFICVLGNEEKINLNKELFKSTINVFK